MNEDRGHEKPGVDWAQYMRGLGRHKRRMREFLGLSQEQLARLAGVSQGAISRLEAGRGLATPLLVVVKINAALKREFGRFDPELLSEEARQLRDQDDRSAPPPQGFRDVPLTRDPCLEELIRLYQGMPDRQHERLLSVVRATATALAGDGTSTVASGREAVIDGVQPRAMRG